MNSRPAGRSLSDFGKLLPAERALLKASRNGEVATIGSERPKAATKANRLRSSFVRFLVLGGDEAAPVHEHGVQLQGAWLDGELDLYSARAAALLLCDCQIPSVDVTHARLDALLVAGSRIEDGFFGSGLQCGQLVLRQVDCLAKIQLQGAVIEGDVDCQGARIMGRERAALVLDGARISRAVFLSNGFLSFGEVRLVDAKIGASLFCNGGKFRNTSGNALFFDRAEIAGSVLLNDAFFARGEVRLLGAIIGSNLECLNSGISNRGGNALICDGTRVKGTFFLGSTARIFGDIHLTLMSTDTLCDDCVIRPAGAGNLILDGLTYDRLTGTRTDSATRVAWLKQQRVEHLEDEFKPQPWEQLIAVLRKMGLPEDARAVAVEKQNRLRKSNRISRGVRPFHWLYGVLVGYGYRPLRLMAVTTAVWLLCAGFYWVATNPAPGSPHVIGPPLRDGKVQVADYSNFVPLIYSADVLLPVIDLGYKDEWQPIVSREGKPLRAGQLLRFLYWFEIAFGWVAGLLLVGVLGNLIKKD